VTDNALSEYGCHFTMQCAHTDYARLLFVDYSSAFNTILPHGLVRKLLNLRLPHSTCLRIQDFLSECPQRVRIGPRTSAPLTLGTGSPQGCVLSPLLFTLYTSGCTPIHTSNTFIKYVDGTTVVGCITGGDESGRTWTAVCVV